MRLNARVPDRPMALQMDLLFRVPLAILQRTSGTLGAICLVAR